jgi:2-iminobutanoate/2-iminopropanoate deaminase
MTDRLLRSVIEPVNPQLNVSRNANLPHSPGIRIGDYMFLSGMGPVDPLTGGRNLGPIAEQVRQTLRNMAHMLESAGSGLDRIVKMTVVLADARDYNEMNRVWREFFPVDPPARTVCALQLSNGNGVEIECIALAGKTRLSNETEANWSCLWLTRKRSTTGAGLTTGLRPPGSRPNSNSRTSGRWASATSSI